MPRLARKQGFLAKIRSDELGWQDCILLVRAEASNGFSVGTGFLVSPNVILTAAHVIPVGIDANCSIEIIRLVDPLRTSSSQLREATEAGKVIWRDDKADVAALSVEGSKSSEWISFLAALPSGVATVVTRGFPNGGRVAGERASTPVSGVLHQSSGIETFHTVEITIAVDRIEDWEGFSGAPVIEQLTGQAVGIVVRARSAFSGARYLEVLSAEFLLSLPGMLDCLNMNEYDLLVAVKKSRICALIASGETIEKISKTHSHKDWFIAEAERLCRLGLIDRKNGYKVLPAATSIIRHVKSVEEFEHLI